MKNSFEKFAAHKIQPSQLNYIRGGEETVNNDAGGDTCTGGGFLNVGHWSFGWTSDTIDACGHTTKHGTSTWHYGIQFR